MHPITPIGTASSSIDTDSSIGTDSSIDTITSIGTDSSIDTITSIGTDSSIDASTSIDMVTPAQVCTQLCLDEQRLLDLVNQGELAAYDIGGEIRFKTIEVVTAIALLAVA